MKACVWFLFVLLAVAQALEPRQSIIDKEKLYPKKTLKEWQEILEKTQYVPPNRQVRGTVPQPASSGRALAPQIIGGDTAMEEQFPWQISATIDDNRFCGGSLISPEWVLTTGHCIGNTFLIRAGSLHPYNGGQTAYSSHGIRHKDYNINNNYDNDIGLILISGISFNSKVFSVLLPRHDIGNLVGVTARVSGWGSTSDSSSLSSVLKFVDLNIVDVSICLDIYGQYLPGKTICTDTSNGKSICYGDNGSPLIRQERNGYWTQVGIVSLAYPYTCERGWPDVFTRVSAHLDWIAQITGLRV